MRKTSLVIQNGHRNALNGQTGTSGYLVNGEKMYEVDYIDRVFYAMRDRLISAGIELYYDDAKIDLKDKDYFVAIHLDGSANKDSRGGFVDDTPDDAVYKQSMQFAKYVADNYFPKIGIPYVNHQSPNSTYYYAFNETSENTKQFLIELGTMTNKDDMERLSDINLVASLLSDAIISYFTLYDTNYQEYIKSIQSQSPGPTDQSAIIEDLKRQLKRLQNETNDQLARMRVDCDRRLQEYKNETVKFVQSL